MKEVEILVKVLESKEEAIKKLKTYKFKGVNEVKDIYFYDPKSKDLMPDKDFRLKNSFRLRMKNNRPYMAYKVDNFDSEGLWSYSDEYEIEISDFNTGLKIINQIGLKELITIENKNPNRPKGSGYS